MKLKFAGFPFSFRSAGLVAAVASATVKSILLLLLASFAFTATEVLGQQPDPLRVTCPSNRTNWICGGSFAFVTYPAPATTAGCPTNAVVTCSPPSGALFTLGTTTVNCTATNSCRESASCSFNVTVAHDTAPPVIQCPTNRVVWICGASTTPVSFPLPPATDNADTNVSVVCSPPSGSSFPVGTTAVICTATDDCTNRSSCTFTVTVNRDTAPPSMVCPTNVITSICSTCAVSQCVADAPPPIRPASIGNGLFYNSTVSLNQYYEAFGEQMLENTVGGHHAVYVNAYQPPGASGETSVEFNSAWVSDDDSAFNDGYGVTRNISVEFLQIEDQMQQALRPISLSGYKTSANESRFAVVRLHDDSAYPWRIIIDRDFDQYQAEAEALAAQGYRPISVSGYSFDGVNPRYSAIFVQDGMTENNWATAHRIAEEDYQAWHDQYSNQGFQPISVSAFTIGEGTFFTAVMVRAPNSGPYAAAHGLTENEFLAANAAWTDPANQFNTTLRPVVVAAYRSFYNGGAKRYAAVWRGSAPREFTATGVAQPALTALDTAMRTFMDSRDINAATLCVSKDGGIVLHRGYTWAPGEFKRTQPCSRFRIASASKALTATAVMKLLKGNFIVGMKGGGLQALTLDTPVFQVNGMPDLPATYGRDAQGITIRHLLQHRAGWDRDHFEPLFNDLHVAAALNTDTPLTRQERINFMMTPAIWPTPNDPASVGYMNSPPGTVSAYSNFGFSILAELIEVISNQPYEDYVRNNILLPMGASRTHLGFTGRLLAWKAPDEVTYTAGNSYNKDGIDLRRWYVSDSNYDPLNIRNPTTLSVVFPGEGGTWRPTTAYGRYNIHTIDGAGGWVATSDDLVRLLRSFDAYNPAQPNNDTPLLDWDSVWEMWSNPNNIFPLVGNNYVLGWQQAVINTPGGNVTAHFHGGNVDGALAIICRRSDGISFAAMFSREAGGGAFTALNNAINTITSWPACSDGAKVSFPAPVVTDNADAHPTVACVPPSESLFPLGSTTVTCTAKDNCGNERACSFLVTVRADSAPPSIQCPASLTVFTCTDFAIVQYSVGATDDRDTNVTVVCTPSSGSLFPIGVTTVNCAARDDCGNISSCSFSVNVRVPRIVVAAIPGGMILSWPDGGVLEEAETVNGPWRPDPHARSPHRVGATRAQWFFRLAVIAEGNRTQTFCPSGSVAVNAAGKSNH